MRTYVRVMIVCLLIPRFELLTPLGSREELLREPLALAPEPDREQVVGEASGAAEALGVHAGMRLARRSRAAPSCGWSRPTPSARRPPGSRCSRALEGIGAAVESARAGRGLLRRRRVCGGSTAATSKECWRACARRSAMPARIGVGAEPLLRLLRGRPRAAGAAARRSFPPAPSARSSRRCRLRCCARGPRPSLAGGPRKADLPTVLERLGIRTLGELAALRRGRDGGPLRPARPARARACARA